MCVVYLSIYMKKKENKYIVKDQYQLWGQTFKLPNYKAEANTLGVKSWIVLKDVSAHYYSYTVKSFLFLF